MLPASSFGRICSRSQFHTRASLIQNQVVDIHPWLTMTGFADIMAIAEMPPGPIAVNAATFVGIQVAGLPGALLATIGCIFPSCVIVMTLAYVYYLSLIHILCAFSLEVCRR